MQPLKSHFQMTQTPILNKQTCMKWCSSRTGVLMLSFPWPQIRTSSSPLRAKFKMPGNGQTIHYQPFITSTYRINLTWLHSSKWLLDASTNPQQLWQQLPMQKNLSKEHCLPLSLCSRNNNFSDLQLPEPKNQSWHLMNRPFHCYQKPQLYLQTLRQQW